MDDILRDINKNAIDQKLEEINSLHPSLKFTVERETNCCTIPFLDMKITRSENKLESSWYTKDTDTGLLMNFHALAPLKYKKSVVIGMIHRIFRACSSYKTFHEGLERAKVILNRNQYPEPLVDSIIRDTLNKLFEKEEPPVVEENEDEEDDLKMFFVEYREKLSEELKHNLGKLKAPCRVIFTLKKLKTVLPSLKSSVEKSLKSGVVYKITCPRCNSCYMSAKHGDILSPELRSTVGKRTHYHSHDVMSALINNG
ncbi:uncharacterized protein [Clytia hemisphaerica]|uniref:uncharacterized protein n=1 Tax=Clytia hemisphaerica TaxID=252671 RepID=UPI0034D52F4E